MVLMLISLTASHNWKNIPIRCEVCILNGVLDEEVYVEQLKCFNVKGEENKVYCLKKTL